MALKIQLPVFLLLLLIATAACFALATKDPELKQCRHQCQVQQQFDEKQKRDCERSCEEYYKQKEEEEWRKKGKGRNFEREKEEEEEEDEDEETEQNPYVFGDEHYIPIVETEQGKVWVLRKFTERSKLLRGIENFRIAILEANPSSFITPTHFDAEVVLFVVQGKATISMIKESRSSFNLKQGDVIRIPSGTPFYMINTDQNEKLKIIKLVQPTSVPGHFEAFHGVGGEDPESFYTAFSWELLEAAFKIPRENLKSLFKKQNEGIIMKASKEQIKSFSQHEEMIPRIWPFSEVESEHPFNLLNQRPHPSNNFGRLFEALPENFSQLRQLGIAISFANITKGSMVAPHYNSKSINIGVVTNGEGGLEMACPHISSTSGRKSESGRSSYEKIRGNLKRGVVFVVPNGHPISLFASSNKNLEVVNFQINAIGNMRYVLTGKHNVVNKMEMMATELGFKTPGKEVQKMFKQQEGDFFFPGPKQQTQRHEQSDHHHHLGWSNE